MAKKVKRARKNNPSKKQRPLPLRYVLIGVAVVALAVLFPLFAVWKQVYITNSALSHDQLIDSISVLNQKVVALRLAAGRLSSNERIERIARQSLDLHYPSSKQIVIVRPQPKPRRAMFADWKFLAVLRKSLKQEKG
jgi:cell division protein FtsL